MVGGEHLEIVIIVLIQSGAFLVEHYMTIVISLVPTLSFVFSITPGLLREIIMW
jgi:hypothetical protein